ncbi:MAG TPA: hypothetical protein VGI39_19745 [Polyangiaceae bacterium]
MQVRAVATTFLVATLFVLSLSQCSLVTPTDGLSNGTDNEGDGGPFSTTRSGSSGVEGGLGSPTPAKDAAAPGPDGSIGSTGIPDASGGAPPDGSGSSPPPTDASPTPGPLDAGSNPTLLFSDDFEGSQPLPRAWDTIIQDDGTLALDTSTSASAATSLRANAQPLAAGAPGNAANITLRKRFAMPAAGETLGYRFQTFLSQSDQNGANAVIGAFQIADAANDLYELQLDVRLAGAGVYVVILAEYAGFSDGGSAYTAHPVTATLPANSWVPVEIQFTASQPPVARLYFDQTLELETSLSVPVAGNAVQLSLGLSYVSAPSSEWVVNYDDAELWAYP